ncbi:MAG: galactokinase [Runella slithyformis]|nr:MAG: galactokinase [Runella slithyformis]
MHADSLKKQFQTAFTTLPTLVVRAPGRINLIGEHTDYNGGFVMPASIDKAIWFAAAPRSDQQCVLVAADLNEKHEFALSDLSKSDKSWTQYPMGVLNELMATGLMPQTGFNLLFGGNIPLGAGLSSSAAVECGTAFVLNELFGFGLSRLEMVKIAQRAENNFVGLQCGIMDMFASMMGKAASVIRLDCRSLEYTYFPFNAPHHSLVLCDSGVKHALAGSEYNTRRQECETGVNILQQFDNQTESLRDVSMAFLQQHQAALPPVVYQRCQYIVSEIERVRQAGQLLEAGNLVEFGQLMYQTHDGLQHQYEVSCPELDLLVAHTRSLGSVLGARLMGGGFGGCTLNLVEKSHVSEFIENITHAYQIQTGIDLTCHEVVLSNGTEKISD